MSRIIDRRRELIHGTARSMGGDTCCGKDIFKTGISCIGSIGWMFMETVI